MEAFAFGFRKSTTMRNILRQREVDDYGEDYENDPYWQEFVRDQHSSDDFDGTYTQWQRRGYTEVHLNLSKWRKLLRAGFTWKDLVALAKKHCCIWITDEVFVWYEYSSDFQEVHWELGLKLELTLYLGRIEVGASCLMVESIEPYSFEQHGRRPFGILFELLAQEPVRSVCAEIWDGTFLNNGVNQYGGSAEFISVSADSLALLKCHETVTFKGCSFSAEHCQMLATFSNPSICFDGFNFEDGARAIMDAVGSDHGPTQLTFQPSPGRTVDSESLQNMLANTTTLKSFKFLVAWDMRIDIESLIRGLAQNESLVELSLKLETANQHQWDDIIQSVRRHPHLRELYLNSADSVRDNPDTDEDKIRRARLLMEVLETNEVLTEVSGGVLDQQILQESIQPRLKNNLRKLRLKALEDEPDDLLQKRLVGTALSHQVSRDDPSFMWLLLSTFHEFVADQYELTRESEVTENGPVSSRTRTRKKPRLL